MASRRIFAGQFKYTRSKRFAWLVLLAGLLLLPQQALGKPLFQSVDTMVQCLAVADEDLTNNPDDTLVWIDRTTGQTAEIGLTGTEFMEAISFDSDGNLLGANLGQLGELDLATGQFTAHDQPFGTAGGSQGEIPLSDVDSLSYDLANDRLYGVHRRITGGDEADLLFVINPATGAHVPGFFGPNDDDYVPVEVVTDASGNSLRDVDDIAIDPTNGDMYAAINNGGTGGILGIIDPATGSVSQIAAFQYPVPNPGNPELAGEVIDDMEGLAFFNDGHLYGSTGEHGPDSNDSNKLFRIDKQTGVGFEIAPFSEDLRDYEALECLTNQPLIVLEKHTNGQDADDPTGPFIDQGDAVQWTYMVTNTGIVTLTDVTVTDDQGVTVSCPATELAPGAGMTCTATGAAQAGQYANIGSVTGTPTVGPSDPVTDSDPSHYFGVQPDVQPDVDIEKATNGQDADTPTGPTVSVGSTVTWTYVVENTGNITLTNVVVTDDLEGEVCVIASLAPGASDTCELTGAAQEGQYANTGTVTGTPQIEGSEPVTDSDPSHYFGEIVQEPAAVGDFVWFDDSEDGIQDAGEQGVEGIAVRLYSGNFEGTPIRTTETNGEGEYLFTELAPGAYCLEFEIPEEFIASPANVGDDDTVDSDGETVVNATTIRTSCFELAAGQVDLSRDLGIYEETDPTGEEETEQPKPSMQHLYIPSLQVDAESVD